MRIAEARWALRQGRTARARRALRTLIAAGQTDPGIFLWAGQLAEGAKDWAEAETYYAQARRSSGRSSELATLYLARLWFFTGRHDESARLLQAHLDARPEDASARALLALVAEARRNPRPER
jgi:predicted Zn-dependent protease